jgi:hypothetical protein
LQGTTEVGEKHGEKTKREHSSLCKKGDAVAKVEFSLWHHFSRSLVILSTDNLFFIGGGYCALAVAVHVMMK